MTLQNYRSTNAILGTASASEQPAISTKETWSAREGEKRCGDQHLTTGGSTVVTEEMQRKNFADGDPKISSSSE